MRQGLKIGVLGNSLEVQWSGFHDFTAEGLGSIPDWGNKIPQAVQCGHNNNNDIGFKVTQTLSSNPRHIAGLCRTSYLPAHRLSYEYFICKMGITILTLCVVVVKIIYQYTHIYVVYIYAYVYVCRINTHTYSIHLSLS